MAAAAEPLHHGVLPGARWDAHDQSAADTIELSGLDRRLEMEAAGLGGMRKQFRELGREGLDLGVIIGGWGTSSAHQFHTNTPIITQLLYVCPHVANRLAG